MHLKKQNSEYISLSVEWTFLRCMLPFSFLLPGEMTFPDWKHYVFPKFGDSLVSQSTLSPCETSSLHSWGQQD